METRKLLLPLLCAFVLVLVSVEPVSGQACPDVAQCMEAYTDAMDDKGHDQEEYCRQRKVAIDCVNKAVCGAGTAKHKNNELRSLQNDPRCNGQRGLHQSVGLVLLATLLVLFWYT